jgi:hypothetical protein
MNIDRLADAVSFAQDAHEKYPQISLDAHFIAAFLAHRKPHQADVEASDTYLNLMADLDKIRGTSGTASEIFKKINWREPSAREARECGMALRNLGHTPRKSNGRLIFDV